MMAPAARKPYRNGLQKELQASDISGIRNNKYSGWQPDCRKEKDFDE